MDVSKNKINRHRLWTKYSPWRVWLAMMAMMAMVLQLSVPLGQGLVASAFANGQDDTAMPLMICS
ncbi:MAG: hypothetical protein JKY92_03290, partial [Magnetovibrio sp.]|nr:hypothetical protein [Magnetovibrio sp.]